VLEILDIYGVADYFTVVSAANGKMTKVKKTDLKRDDFSLQFGIEGDV